MDLITGRTHQIRVHMAAIGHPLAGDPWYGTGTSKRGAAGLNRLFLHSWRIELQSPDDGHLIRAEAPLPAELEAVLQDLRTQTTGESTEAQLTPLPEEEREGESEAYQREAARTAGRHKR
jgi:hypothetical protein